MQNFDRAGKFVMIIPRIFQACCFVIPSTVISPIWDIAFLQITSFLVYLLMPVLACFCFWMINYKCTYRWLATGQNRCTSCNHSMDTDVLGHLILKHSWRQQSDPVLCVIHHTTTSYYTHPSSWRQWALFLTALCPYLLHVHSKVHCSCCFRFFLYHTLNGF